MQTSIPEETVESVRQQVDIVDVIGETVHLQKKGKHRYAGLCPFHEEKTPSFSVSDDRQLYYCFGCGAAGNVFTFVMEQEQLTFQEAVSRLAEKTDISIAVPVGQGHVQKRADDVIKEGCALAARFYHHLLMHTEQGREAYEYVRDRQISDEALSHFQIGFAPREREALSMLLKKRDFDPREMEAADLVQTSESGHSPRDRFNDRLMFPIWDMSGHAIAFGGRALDESTSKYLNSRETPVFKKNEILYAYHLARPHVRKRKFVVLFEGYMDVVSAWMAGVDNGVATLGTALTSRQADLIRRMSDQVTICYDGDSAGQKAAIENAALLEANGCQVKIAPIPVNQDPDDYIRAEGPGSFMTNMIEGAQSVISFKMNAYKKEKNLQREGDRKAYIEWVLEALTDVGSPVEREFYLKQLADEFSVSMEALKQEQSRIFKEVRRKSNRSEARPGKDEGTSVGTSRQQKKLLPAFHNAERALLQLMMEDEAAAKEVEEEIGGEFNVDEHAAIAAYLFAYYGEGHPAGSAGFLNFLTDETLTPIAAEIAMQPAAEINPKAYADYIHQVKNYPSWVEIEQKENAQKEAIRKNDMETATKLGQEIIALQKSLGRKTVRPRYLRTHLR
ncbi:DNA primase [Natribacillus halophilus]|uniref:DNA primase n=1 Tax=Natribacillus halophilus TaxID=549003 RepID=A0A1G8JRQ1_9BACI|nr:DNA primase [Natribacillus halophilus]SDI33801.1 DNA primase [Natribacillus halophilus]